MCGTANLLGHSEMQGVNDYVLRFWRRKSPARRFEPDRGGFAKPCPSREKSHLTNGPLVPGAKCITR